jgi:CHASE3 domain sensor protein
MAAGQSGNLSKAIVLVVGIVLLTCICGVLYLSSSHQQVPVQDQEPPDPTSELKGLQAVCVNRASSLKGEGIDGEVEYEKAQRTANEHIGYLDSVLSSGSGDQEQIKKRLESTFAACSSFVAWADKKIPPKTGAMESASFDIQSFAFSIMRLLKNPEQERRKAVRESLHSCKFPSWKDIPSGTGPAKKSTVKR